MQSRSAKDNSRSEKPTSRPAPVRKSESDSESDDSPQKSPRRHKREPESTDRKRQLSRSRPETARRRGRSDKSGNDSSPEQKTRESKQHERVPARARKETASKRAESSGSENDRRETRENKAKRVQGRPPSSSGDRERRRGEKRYDDIQSSPKLFNA